VAAISLGFDPLWMLPGLAVMVALLGFRFLTRTVAGARRAGGGVLAGAVVFYAVVISAMVVTAWGTGLVVAASGATCFAVSDWVLGHRRFADRSPEDGWRSWCRTTSGRPCSSSGWRRAEVGRVGLLGLRLRLAREPRIVRRHARP
jgi:hypothetical protein